jgi:chromate reductase
MTKFKIAAVVGSNRRESLNKKLAQALARLGEDRFSFRFVQIDDLPLYNQDLESPLPASVARFKSQIANADGVLFVTPEHSRSIPAVLKSAIDWGARPYGQTSWDGKPAAITGATPGTIGTAVAQQHLRAILGDLGMLVLGGEAYLSVKPGLIDEKNVITDESTRAFLKTWLDRFGALVARNSVVQEMAA